MCAKYNQGERSSPDEITLYTLFRVSSDQLKCQEIVSIDKSKSNQTHHFTKKTSQELRMLSSVTIYCQITKIVMNSGSQLSEL